MAGSAEDSRPCLEIEKSASAPRLRRAQVKAGSVVADTHSQGGVAPVYPNGYRGRSGVFLCVCQGFLQKKDDLARPFDGWAPGGRVTLTLEAMRDALEEPFGDVFHPRLEIGPAPRDGGEQPDDVTHVVERLAGGIRDRGKTFRHRITLADAAAGEVALQGEMAEAGAEFVVEITGDAPLQLLRCEDRAAALGKDDDDGSEGDKDNGETGAVEPTPQRLFAIFLDEDGEGTGPCLQFLALGEGIEPGLPLGEIVAAGKSVGERLETPDAGRGRFGGGNVFSGCDISPC